MEDTIEYTIETYGLTFPITVEFSAVRGHISYDYFEPSEPDEISIDNLKMYGHELPLDLYEYVMYTYENDIHEKIEEYLLGKEYDEIEEPDFE